MLTYDANQVVALRLHWALKSPGITFITSFRNSDPESLMLELGICFLSFFLFFFLISRASLVAQMVKNPPAIWET